MRRTILLGTLVTTFAGVAYGQSAEDKTRAEALFDSANKAMAAGRLSEACAAYADSQRLDPGIGTALRLGDCLHKWGKIASAAKAFRTALDMARRQDDKRAAVAEREIDLLHPSKVTLNVDVEIDGLEITIDGAPIASRTVEIDGGNHTIVATAPRHEMRRIEVNVPDEGGDVKTAIALAPTGTSAQPHADHPIVDTTSVEPPSTSSSGSGSGLRIAGVVTGSIGLLGLFAGTVLGVTALGKWNDSNNPGIGGCDPDTTKCQLQRGVDLRSDANALGAAATVGFIAGSVLAAVGITMFVIGVVKNKNDTTTALRVGPAGVALGGTF